MTTLGCRCDDLHLNACHRQWADVLVEPMQATRATLVSDDRSTKRRVPACHSSSAPTSPTDQIVEDANEMLVRMTHRGACGCEENTGDGAGILVAIPDEFLRKAAAEAGIGELPPKGEYAVGNIFVPKYDDAVPEAKAIVERVCKQRGMKVTDAAVWCMGSRGRGGLFSSMHGTRE